MNRGLLLLLLLCTFNIVVVNAQSIRGFEELSSYSGAPCIYGPYTSSAGSPGCWGAGACYNNRFPDVSWYQNWNCSNGYVTARGSSSVIVENDGAGPFNVGLYANGRADLYKGGPPIIYQGWDEDNCNGDTDYSGAYSYTC